MLRRFSCAPHPPFRLPASSLLTSSTVYHHRFAQPSCAFSSLANDQPPAALVIPHTTPSPHGPPLFLPVSTRPVEEAERRAERDEDTARYQTVKAVQVRETTAMVNVAELIADQGRREVAEKLRRLEEKLKQQLEEAQRRKAAEAAEAEERRRAATLRALQREVATQRETRLRAEREQAQQEKQARKAAADNEAAQKLAHEQRTQRELRAAELTEQHKKAEQHRMEARAAKKSSDHAAADRSSRGQRENELREKQEKERAERARWSQQQQQRSTGQSTPPPVSRTDELKKQEETIIRQVKELDQQQERKEHIIVQDEKARIAAQKERERKEQLDKERADKAAAAAAEAKRKEEAERTSREDAERKRKQEEEAVVARMKKEAEEKSRQQQQAEEKRKTEEERRKQEDARREAAARQREEQQKKEAEAEAAAERQKQQEAVQRLQKQQQEDLIRSLQQRQPSSPAVRAAVVLTSGASSPPPTPPPPPPPSGGGGSGRATVVVSTPVASVVRGANLQETKQSARGGSWMPYALIAGGVALLLAYSTLKRSERSYVVTSTLTTSERLPSLRPVIEDKEDEEHGEAEREVAVRRVRRLHVRKSPAPPSLPPLSPQPAIPELDDAAFPALRPAAALASSSSASDPALSLQRLLDGLQVLDLQRLLSSLSDLQTDEANYLRSKLRARLNEQLNQLEQRVRELRSGVEVSVDAPLLSHRGEHDDSPKTAHGTSTSIDELKRSLAALQRQYAYLTHSEPAPTGQADRSSALSMTVQRAKQEVDKQMESAYSTLLREHQDEAARLAQQLLSLEQSIGQSMLQQQVHSTVEQAVDGAKDEERERWLEVESSELRAQRDDLMSLTRLYLLRQRQDLDRQNDREREQRMAEVNALARRMHGFLDSFKAVLRETSDSERLHQVALAALALDSLTHEDEIEREEESGRQHKRTAYEAGLVQEWRRLWRLRSGDAVIDAAVSSIPPHALTSGVYTVRQLRQRWRRVRAALKEEAFVPKLGEREDGRGRSVWAQLTGKLFSLLYLSPSSPAASAAVVHFDSGEGGGNEIDVVDRMNAAVAEKRWGDVLRLEAALSPNSRALCEGWRQAVQDRMVVDQALQTVKARVICLSLDM